MNNKKLRFTVLSILVLAIVCLAMFSGCKKDKGGDDDNGAVSQSTEIFVEKSHQPRLLYVEGQDFDLSSGAVTVSKNGENTRIPFNDQRVSVTGYDKNTLGDQTVTVSCEGKTTTLKVRVIARMTVENVETEYFTGEQFSTKGRVKVAKDDASTMYVDMKSSSISVVTFNNTAAGKSDVVIKYTDGSASYECSFPVTFYEPEEITFNAPTKKDYLSHEEALNFQGGYLYLKAAKPSTFKKSISLTNDMVVSGFGYDPTAVTEANKDVALTQTIKITYAGREWSFDVDVLYSPVYVINGLESKLGNVDSYLELKENQTVADLKLPAGAGEAAKEAIVRYLDMSTEDQDLIDDTLILNFARVAALYINTNDYVNAVNDLNNAFVLTADGKLTYVGESYDIVKTAIEALEDPESDYNASARLLLAIKNEFGEEDFNAAYKISALTSPHTEEVATSIAERLKHMIAVYDILKNIPTTWKAELETDKAKFETDYKDAIVSAVFTITSSEFKGAQYSGLYAVITRWRSDFFEIIYSYYYYAKEGGKDQIYNDLWDKVPAPGLLEEFWNAFNSAYQIGAELTTASSQNSSQVRGYDLFAYHYFYHKAVTLSKQIKESGNELYTNVYEALTLDAYIEVYLNAPSVKLLGYTDFMGPVLDNEKVIAVLDKYCDIIDVYATTGQISGSAQNRAKIIDLFDAIIDLSPAELHWFLSAISYNYHSYSGQVLMFDPAPMFNPQTKWRSFLSQLLYGFIFQELPKVNGSELHPAQAIFANLLQAMEVYSAAQYNDKAIEEFKTYMKTATEQYQELIKVASDKATFDSILGDAWAKYSAIYSLLITPNFSLNTDMSAKFDELYSTLEEFNNILMNADKKNLPTAYPMFMALYQKAKTLYNEIYAIAEVNSSVRNALNAKIYTFVEVIDEQNSVTWSFSLDMYYYYIKSVAYGSMIPNGHLNYVDSISTLLIDLIPIFRAEFNETVYTGTDVNALAEKVRALNDQQKSAFCMINADLLYFAALNRYVDTNYADQTTLNPGDASAKIDELMATIKEFIEVYAISQDRNNPNQQEAYPMLIALFSKAKTLYGEITAMADGNEAIKNALNYKLYTITVGENTSESTVDEYYIYISHLAYGIIASDERIYAAASIPAVKELLIKLLPLFRAEIADTVYTGTDIYELLAAVRALNPSDKYEFYILQGNVVFYAGLERYLNTQISATAKEKQIISYLFNAEIYYSLYELDENDTASIETFKTAMENAMAAYEALTAEDKALLGDLYYGDLLEKYNTLFPADEPAA